MDVYKLRTTERDARPIDRIAFENQTMKRPPYYQRNESGGESQFAVCPACNNPIQLIGLYPKKSDSKKPFGRHVPHSIRGLADYSRDGYEFCPYANPCKYVPTDKKRSKIGVSDEILKVLQEQYDSVICLLEKETGIAISEKLATSMLENYLGVEGHMYAGASLMNIPWILAYRAGNFPLYGRVIRKDSKLAQQIMKYGEHVGFNEKGQLVSKEGMFLDMSFCFVGHDVHLVDFNLEESMYFYVNQVVGGKQKNILRQKIIFDYANFQNLTNLSVDHPNRRMNLVEIARKLIQA